jgi:redox-sensitive bicupin YhaK (pirin superfamily)
MRAAWGRGLVHAEISSEEFKRKGGPLEILQLWVNLPSRLKMAKPAYVGLQRDAIPALPTEDGKGTLNLIAGAWGGRTGSVETLLGLFMSTLDLKAGGRFALNGLEGRNVFFYVARGAVVVNGRPVDKFNLVQLAVAGDEIAVEATADSVILFGHGTPIGEPVVSYGPFVMNTREEIGQAIRDYQAGLFGGGLA